jgi:DNA-directed RNA polymerase specialized sigma24 family protein
MRSDLSGSIWLENNNRIQTLYVKHHNWLVACSKNITNNIELGLDLVGDLYLYLGQKINPKIWYLDSFNLQYCRAFLSSRFLNHYKRSKKIGRLNEGYDVVDEPYDEEFDKRLDTEYNRLVVEIGEMKKRQGWQSAMLWEMYMFSEDTMESLAKKIGLSKSTVYLNTKKVKIHLQNHLNNPFKTEEND